MYIHCLQVHMMLLSCSNNVNFENMCDEVLADTAARGSVLAFSVIISRYLRLVKMCAIRYKNLSLEMDDLSQEGLIGLISAVRTYNESFGTSFKTYAQLCIERSMISSVKATLAKKRIPEGLIQSLSESDSILTGSEDPVTSVIAKEDLDIFLKNACKVLSLLEYNVMNEYLAGLSYKEIAGKIGISVKTVDNAMRRVRRKLR